MPEASKNPQPPSRWTCRFAPSAEALEALPRWLEPTFRPKAKDIGLLCRALTDMTREATPWLRAFVFNIKSHKAYYLPDEITDQIRLDSEQIHEEIADLALHDLDEFVSTLCERYDWLIHNRWDTSGQSGGYLELYVNEHWLMRVWNLTDQLTPTPWGEVLRGQPFEDWKGYVGVLVGAVEIERELALAIERFEQHVRTPEFWGEYWKRSSRGER